MHSTDYHIVYDSFLSNPERTHITSEAKYRVTKGIHIGGTVNYFNSTGVTLICYSSSMRSLENYMAR